RIDHFTKNNKALCNAISPFLAKPQSENCTSNVLSAPTINNNVLAQACITESTLEAFPCLPNICLHTYTRL
uniref:Uncharacterized protein n=1 Tax=Anopheles funestus TaxID=62324 RepID=A0A182S4B9_ANOFN